ncbi:MAG: hypothetical protein IJY39_04450 [Clostridia bacterium]|nr:hypothetical protein [Clostridia bacterium]
MKRILALLLAVVLCLSLFVACDNGGNEENTTEANNNEAVEYSVEDATAYLKNMYKNYLVETETAADYYLISQVMRSGAVYTVDWTVNTDKITVTKDEANKQVLIDLDEKASEKLDYELTATVTAPDGTTDSLVFKLTVPAYAVLSYDAYYATEAGKAVVVEGVVVAVHSVTEGNKYNQMYVQDAEGKGGYYVYSMTIDPVKDLGIKAGMTVSITGTKDIYNGLHEIKDATAAVLDSTVKELAPVDITEIFSSAADCKDENLVNKLGMLVTIKGVEITDQDLAEKSMYFKFKLGNNESYIRVYETDCPASVSDDDMQAIMAAHGEHKGWTADVTGVVVIYSGSIYLNPVSKDAFVYHSLIERTDAEKLQVEIDSVKIDSNVTLDSVIELPLKGTTYEDVTVSWTSDNACAVIADGKATVTLQKEAQTVKLTATYKLGNETKTVEYVLNVAEAPTVAPQVVATPEAGTAYKFVYIQTQLGKNLYFDGSIGSYYANTTDDMTKAVDVYLEAAEGGYYIYFLNGENKVKTYLEAYMSGTYCNLKLTTETPASVFVIDEELNAPIVTLGETTYFLGTYGDKTDIRPSAIKYASQGNYITRFATLVDTSSVSDADKLAAEKDSLTLSKTEFTKDEAIDLAAKGTTYDDVTVTWTSDNACAVVADGKLTVTRGEEAQTVKITATLTCGEATETKEFTVEVAAIPPAFTVEITKAPAADTAYVFMLEQVNLGTTLYLAEGVDSGRYLKTTTDLAQALKIYAEAADGGYKLYVLTADGAKSYLEAYLNSSSKTALGYVEATDCVFFCSETTGAWTTTAITDKTLYIGTYGTYATFSLSDTWRIEGDNASALGTTQYIAQIATVTVNEQ